VYELQRPHLLPQVSEISFEGVEKRGRVEVVECEGGQQCRCLELWEVWQEVLGCKFLSYLDCELSSVPS